MPDVPNCEWRDVGCDSTAVAAVSRSDSVSASNLSYACREHLATFIDAWLADDEVYPIDLQRLDVVCGQRSTTIIDGEGSFCRLPRSHQGRHYDLRGFSWPEHVKQARA